MTVGDFERAGLYDPRAANAAERLELLEWLATRGVTIDQMVAAVHGASLVGLAADLTLRPGPRMTARQVAAESGLSLEQVLEVSLAAGLPPRTADEAIYGADHLHLYRMFTGASGMFGEAAVRRFIRVVGSSLARIAEAAVTLFQVNVEGPMRASGRSELELAQEQVRAMGSLEGVRILMQNLFGPHMETAIRRLREARPRWSVDSARLAVGFVDLVGFTSLSHRLAAAELGELVERFEETAYDVAAARDGRVVKLIGDEVMFVTRDPAAACDIALALFERFEGDASVTPRGGLALGEMLLRGGDYYGPIVNLASRVAELAVPNELLVTRELAEAAAGSRLRFEPAGKRMLKGFDEPVSLLTVERA